MILLGPPGSGKGTYASRLTGVLGVPQISTGDMVREEIRAQTSIGKEIRGYSDRGELVPDSVIIQLLEERLEKPDCDNGFILDGFPRTIAQAEALEKISQIDVVINLNVPDEIIVTRLSNRLICRKCGAIFNKLTLKPKTDCICDQCSNELYQRDDDKTEVIQERLNIYRKNTRPLIHYYRKRHLLKEVHCMDMTTTPEEVVKKIMAAISGKRESK